MTNTISRSCFSSCSFVGREQLPALEFVMSKQPRVIVGVDTQSNGGQRTENVFVAAEKFLKKCAEREQAKKSNPQVNLFPNYFCFFTIRINASCNSVSHVFEAFPFVCFLHNVNTRFLMVCYCE